MAVGARTQAESHVWGYYNPLGRKWWSRLASAEVVRSGRILEIF